MKTKPHILKLIVLFSLALNIKTYSRDNDTIPWNNARSAIINGIKNYFDYMGSKNHKFINCTVFVIKIIKIDEKRGEFSITDIASDWQYPEANPSHYLYSNDRLVLIRADSLKTILSEKIKLPEITNAIKGKAYDILAGPYNLLTGQPSDYMVFNYYRKKIMGKFYCGICKMDTKYHVWNDIH